MSAFATIPLEDAVPLTLMACGLAIALVGLPLWLGKIGPNRLYGISTRATMTSRELWDTVNRAAGRDTMLAGAVTGAAGVLVRLLGAGLPPEVVAIAGAGLLIFPPLIAYLVGHARASRLERDVQTDK